MNEQDLLAIGEILEHPEQYPDIAERDVRDLAISYHLAQADKLAEEIMATVSAEELRNSEANEAQVFQAIKDHEAFPRYAFHIDEVNRNASFVPAEPTPLEVFTESMNYSLDRVLSAAGKVLGGSLLTRDERIEDKADR